MKSDISNFYQGIKAYSDGHEHELSYLCGKWADFTQYQAVARAKIFELLSFFPKPAPMDPIVHETRACDGYTLQAVSFCTYENNRVEGNVLIPNSKPEGGKYPAVIAIHDHSGFYYCGKEKIVEQRNEPQILTKLKNESYGGRSWASELARRGYLVLVIDGYYFGSRRLDYDGLSDEIKDRLGRDGALAVDDGSDEYIAAFNKICGAFEGLLVKHILIGGATWPGMLFHDDRKCIDYLLSRDDVDASRIGCCGLSIGGFRSAHLAALDPRIKCCVATCWMPTLNGLLFDHLRDHTYMIYVPGLTRHMELPDVAGLAAPNALFVQQCMRDALYPLDSLYAADAHIKKVYAAVGCPEQYKSQFYDRGHRFDLEMQRDAFAWLDDKLR